MSAYSNRVSVTGAAQYLRTNLLSEATLVVPDRAAGALLSVVQVNNRLTRLIQVIQDLSSDADLRAAKNRREQEYLNKLNKQKTKSRPKSSTDKEKDDFEEDGGFKGTGGSLSVSNPSANGGGGFKWGEMFEEGGALYGGVKLAKGAFKFAGKGIGLAGRGIGVAGKGAFKFAGKGLGVASKFAGPLLLGVGAVTGGMDIYNDVKTSGKVDYWNAASAGASLGGLIGSVVPVVGTFVGAGIGAALGVGSAAVYNSREEIAKKWGDLSTAVSDAAAATKDWAIAKWDNVVNLWDKSYNYVSNSVKDGWKGLTDNVAKYSNEIATWAENQGTSISEWLGSINTKLRSLLSSFNMKGMAAEWLRKLKDWVSSTFSGAGGGGQLAGAFAGNGNGSNAGGFNSLPGSGGTNPAGPQPSSSNTSLPGRNGSTPDRGWPGTGTPPNSAGFNSVLGKPGVAPAGAGGAEGDVISRFFGEKPAGGQVNPGDYGTPTAALKPAPGRNPNTAGVHPALVEVVNAAAAHLEAEHPGYKVVLNEGYNPRGHVAHSQHHIWGSGALDVQIIDPKGNPIDNEGNDPTNLYTQIHRDIRGEMQARHPELVARLGHGADFNVSRGKDIMHTDMGGSRGDLTIEKLGPRPGVIYGKPITDATAKPEATPVTPFTTGKSLDEVSPDKTIEISNPVVNIPGNNDLAKTNQSLPSVTNTPIPASIIPPPAPPSIANIVPGNLTPVGKVLHTNKMNLDPNWMLKAAEEMEGLRASVPAEAEKLYSIMRAHGVDINPRNIAWCSAGLGVAVMGGGFNAPAHPEYAPNWEKFGKAVSPDKMKSGDIIYTTEAIKDSSGKDTGKKQDGHTALYAGMTRVFNGKTYALAESSNTWDPYENTSGLDTINAENKHLGLEKRSQFGQNNFEWLEIDEHFHARRSLQANPNAKSYVDAKAAAFNKMFNTPETNDPLYRPKPDDIPTVSNPPVAKPSIEPEAAPISDTTPTVTTPEVSKTTVTNIPESAPPATTIAEANGEKPPEPKPEPERKVTNTDLTQFASNDSWVTRIHSVPKDPSLMVKIHSDNN